MTKVLFVCLGNICRSPAAEAIFRDLIEKEKLTDEFSCDSAGTSQFSGMGNFTDERMVKAAKKRRVEISHYSQRIKTSDFEEFDYIVGMDDNNIHAIEIKRDKDFGKAKILKMAQFLPNGNSHVPDPYYRELADFENVLDLLEVGCKSLLDFLQNLHK